MKLISPLLKDAPPGSDVTILKEEETKAKKVDEEKKDKKKEEKKKEGKKKMKEKEVEKTDSTEPSRPGDTSIFVAKKIGKPGDRIMVDDEPNEVAPDTKDAKKEPDNAPPKKGV